MDGKTILSIASAVISLIALFVTLKDRWPRLSVGIRKGEWCKLKPTVDRTQVVFKGLVEVYNVSNRANTIRGYEFWSKEEDRGWIKMDSQLFMESDSGEDKKGEKEVVRYNVTPLTLGPYSGMEVRVMAFKKGTQPAKMDVRMQVTDVFGKKYQAEVAATS